MSESIKDKVKLTFQDSISVKEQIIHNKSYEVLLEAGDIISSSISNGGKLLLCGNGGSAADAQHLAAEFLIRLTSNVNRESIPALSLAQDTSTLTARINDYGPDDVFKRVFSALSAKGDILLVITTSGNSKNIIEVLTTLNLAPTESNDDKIVTKIGAQPLATGYIKVRSSRSYIIPNKIKYRLCNKNEQVI